MTYPIWQNLGDSVTCGHDGSQQPPPHPAGISGGDTLAYALAGLVRAVTGILIWATVVGTGVLLVWAIYLMAGAV